MKMIAKPTRPDSLTFRYPDFARPALAVLFCTVCLSGCVTLSDLLPPPARARQPDAATAPQPPAPPTATPQTQVPLPTQTLPLQYPSRVDFRILEGRVTISRRGYVLDTFERPVITPLGGDVYRLEMKFRRDSKNSFRGDETIVTKFRYDGVELIFFWDANNNNRLDRYESNVRYVIDHKQEIVAEGDRRFARARKLTVHLAKEHTDSAQSVRDLALTLLFQAD